MRAAAPEPRYQYCGDPALGERSIAALHRMIDPEMALDIVELGLVYAVSADDKGAPSSEKSNPAAALQRNRG